MKALILLGLVCFAPVTFAEGDEETDSSGSGRACVEYSPPVCAYGQKIVAIKDGYGCDVPICASPVRDDEDDEFQPEGCPALVIPKCGPGKELVHHTHNRCPYSLCEDKK